MKYLWYTLIIVATAALGSGLTILLRPTVEPSANALVINQRVISPEEIQQRRDNSTYHFTNQDEFLEDLITRQLLIQEAQRQKIDHEEPFRRALQNYYEQSLVKTLLDRQYAKLSAQVSPATLEKYRNNLASHFRLQLSYYRDLQAAKEHAAPLRTSELSAAYLDLPETLRDAVAELSAGETSTPIQMGTSCFRVTVNEKTERHTPALENDSDRSVQQAALEEQKRQQLNAWLNSLRNRAKIRLPAANVLQEQSDANQ